MSQRSLRFVLIGIFVTGVSLSAFGQATRTWVSGVGDDANPCSRTAPCKTFAGAISKTAAGGEIDALDPGGFGGVTITKSITIDGAGTMASVLASGINGILINALSTDVITLRNLSINGANTGLRGIRVLSAKAVHIENCVIFGFRGSPGRGVDINLATGAATKVYIRNTSITNNLAAGVAVAPTSGQPLVHVSITDSNLSDNASGLFAGEGARYELERTRMAGNSFGVDAAGTTVPSQVSIDACDVAFNGTGLNLSGGAQMRISRSGIFGNTTRAFQISGGSLGTYGDNYFGFNGAADVGVLSSVAADKK